MDANAGVLLPVTCESRVVGDRKVNTHAYARVWFHCTYEQCLGVMARVGGTVNILFLCCKSRKPQSIMLANGLEMKTMLRQTRFHGYIKRKGGFPSCTLNCLRLLFYIPWSWTFDEQFAVMCMCAYPFCTGSRVTCRRLLPVRVANGFTNHLLIWTDLL